MLIGLTGTGKSSFIELLTGYSGIRSLPNQNESETILCKLYPFSCEKKNYILIDTIGITDSKG